MRLLAANAFTLLLAAAIVSGGAAGVVNYLQQSHKNTEKAVAMTQGDPGRAMQAIAQYGCAACHNIPGARMPGGLAAMSLSGVADRLYLGGVAENTPSNLVRWIVNPKQFSAKTAMPVTGITEREARDVAAYLYQGR